MSRAYFIQIIIKGCVLYSQKYFKLKIDLTHDDPAFLEIITFDLVINRIFFSLEIHCCLKWTFKSMKRKFSETNLRYRYQNLTKSFMLIINISALIVQHLT